MILVRRLAVLVPVALAPVGLMQVYNDHALETERVAELGGEVSRVAGSLGSETDGMFDNLRATLGALALDAGAAASNASACRKLIDGVGDGWSGIRLRVLDRAGVVRCATDPGELGTRRGDEPEVAAALHSDRAAAGRFESGPFDEGGSRRLAVPWGGRNGVGGVITADLDLTRVADKLALRPLPPGVSFVIDDDAGRVVASASTHPGTRPTLSPARFAPGTRVGALAPDDRAVRVAWPDGLERLTAAVPLVSGSGAPTIAVGVALDDRLASLRAASFRALLLLALALVICTSLAVTGGVVYVSRPIRTLETAVRRWRAGDRHARALLPGRTELTRLGRAFDEMADAIDDGERTRREQGEMLRRLIEAIPDSVAIHAPDGAVLFSNGAQQRMEGLGAAVPEPDVLALVGENGRIAARERTWRGADGGPRRLQTVYAPLIDAAGRVFAIAGIGRDVTDMRHAEEILQHAKDAAESADRAKTRFLAAASHDLRQPIQGALLFAEAAMARVEAPSEAFDAVGRCARALGDITALLDGLLDLSRLDAGLTPVNRTEFPLQPLLEEVAAGASVAAGGKPVRVHAEHTAAIVRSDRALLARMLHNLATNAVRYTDRGEVRLEARRDHGSLRIDVADTGIGIPPAALGTIFEEFHQLQRADGASVGGLGLGLSIVRRLSSLLGHGIAVSSEPGFGSRFSVDVPWAGSSPFLAPPLAAPPALVADGERSALVIDDDRSMLDGMRLLLDDLGLSVSLAETGDDAVAAALHRRPDVLIADYRLGAGLRGTEVIERIRAAVGARVPAVLLTGDSGTEVDDEAERVGVTVLTKPARPARIAAALREEMRLT